MISVVIPLYNKAHTIINTLNTVLAQTFKKFEVIIIDDGSTDNGVALIKEYINDLRIKIIQQKNQGVSVARNTGVKYSQFKYVAFLDADDEWLPAYLSKMHDAVTKFPDAGLFCSAGIVRSNKKEYHRLAQQYEGQIKEIDFFQNPHVFLHSSAVVVDRQLFTKSKGFPVGVKRNEDFALFFNLALQTTVIYIGSPLSIYVGDVEGQATTISFDATKNDIIYRFNTVHKTWLTLERKNKSYEVFTKYELRHLLLGFIQKGEYENILFFKDNLLKTLTAEFYNWEWYLHTKPSLKKFAIAYIYFTKIRWRLRGYPQVKT